MNLRHFAASLYWRRQKLGPNKFYEFFQNPNKLKETYSPNQLSDWRALAKKEFAWCKENQVKITVLGDADYPQELLQLAYPPLILTSFGHFSSENSVRLSVVGSRVADGLSMNWLDQELTAFLKRHSLCVVSGGARGVDQKAHGIALRSGRPTMAFLPSGLSQIYPKAFASWVPSIVQSQGMVISQFSPFEPMRKGHFHIRNQLIAVMGRMLFVVQAGVKSGTMITAGYAADYGRPLGVLPHSPLVSNTNGGLKLLREGAIPILNHQDLKEALVNELIHSPF